LPASKLRIVASCRTAQISAIMGMEPDNSRGGPCTGLRCVRDRRPARLAGRESAETVTRPCRERDRLIMPGVPRLYKSLRVKAVAHALVGMLSDSRCQRRPLAPGLEPATVSQRP
jgi:hypothetical protein